MTQFFDKQNELLIECAEGVSLEAYLSELKSVFTKFHLQNPTYAKSGKLQIGFKVDPAQIEALKHAHYADFENFPADIQKFFRTCGFLFTCFKYHGLCKNEDEHPVLTGAGKLTDRVVLAGEGEGEVVPLGHCYDYDAFGKPISHMPNVIGDEVKIYSNFFEIEITKDSETALAFLKKLLIDKIGLSETSSAYQHEGVVAPHGMPRTR